MVAVARAAALPVRGGATARHVVAECDASHVARARCGGSDGGDIYDVACPANFSGGGVLVANVTCPEETAAPACLFFDEVSSVMSSHNNVTSFP